MPHTNEKVLNIIQRKFKNDKITADSTFGVDFMADSLDRLEIIMDLEEEFDISIPEERGERVKTVKDIVEIVRTCL